MSDTRTAPTEAELAICALCPKLCRHVCPVAVATGHEAAAPSNMALQPWLFLRGFASAELARQAASLCVACGACTAHCDLHEPLGDRLSAMRQVLSPPVPPAPLPAIEGAGRRVAVETDERRWAQALSAHLGEPVARLRTVDHLGWAALTAPGGDPAGAARLRTQLSDRVAVVADHRSLAAAQAAGVQVVHLAELAPPSGTGPVFHPCHGPRLSGTPAPDALACCGAGTALETTHPDLARGLQAEQVARLRAHAGPAPTRCPDVDCSRTLAHGGLVVLDPIDALLAPPSGN